MSLGTTTSRNSFVKNTYDETLAGLPVKSGAAINQGDLVIWDTTANSNAGGLRTPVTQGDMANYVGVASQQTPVASLGDSLLTLAIWRSSIIKFKGTNGETYYNFTEVYFNETADVQTITLSTNSNARTVPVGWVILPSQLGMSGVFSLVAGAATDVPVWVNPKFPISYLV